MRPESENHLGSNDNTGRQGISQESNLKYLNELYDDYVDNLTKAKPNAKQSKIRKYFTNLTVRDKSEVEALIYETCGGGWADIFVELIQIKVTEQDFKLWQLLLFFV